MPPNIAVPPHEAQAFPAPAKLNLDLRITGRRSDGYHNLESIFCLIGLYDTVYLLPRDDGRILLHTPAADMPSEQDLCHRAAVLLQSSTGSRQGADIWLDKNIPMGGGLGGGSSDAATVLMALNRLWRCGLTREELMRLGLKLGADVPFFIFGRNAFARGVGERLEYIEVPQMWYAVVRPPVHVSTAAVFSHENLTRDSKPSIMPSFLSLQPFRNDMQSAVFQEYPEVAEAHRKLSRYGEALMTGSGACVFAACESREKANSICRQLSETYETYCVEGLGRHPLHDMVF